MNSLLTPDLNELRQQVLIRFAAALGQQTRVHQYSVNVTGLARSLRSEVRADIRRALIEISGTDKTVSPEREKAISALQDADSSSRRFDQAMALLFQERQRQYAENGEHVQKIMLDFNRIIESYAGTLIEKSLLERQSRILEAIVLSHENVTQWKVFVQEILKGFHSIFPFNYFFIAFSEEHGLSLCLYHMGQFSEDEKRLARTKLVREVLDRLHLPSDAPLELEEFEVLPGSGSRLHEEGVDMIAVPVQDIEMPNLGGILGVVFGSSRQLTAQEESVIRSTLAVMVLVVGSSKTLSRTLSELEYYSTHDPLTGLHNRRYFNEMISYEEGRSERHGHEFSVLMLDLDDFKDVNDTYGHPCGDSVLKQVANTIRSAMRKGDVATRIGGDEFAVILTETSKEGGIVVAEKLRSELKKVPFESPDGNRFHITTSIGMVTFPEDGKSVSDLMAGVDMGLYRAKQLGKDGVASLESVADRIRLQRTTRAHAEKLREALKQNRMVPYYHAIYECGTRNVFAYEALARLQEADGATVSAGVFIETIEKYGWGRELDRVILNHGLRDVREWKDLGIDPPRLFINLAAQDIQGRGILGFAEHLCQELDIAPRSLVFEILERDAISDMSSMRKFLANLREKGFAFALDDFGSGYNSFHYLRELRFDYVKLDGAFVKNILNSRTDRVLVSNLTRLCRELDILTVAEFVESEKILEALQDMGVDYAQGFHLSMPLPVLPHNRQNMGV